MTTNNYQTLLAQIAKDRIPEHVAIIMDGNGRWAKQRHLPRIKGHQKGIESVREAVKGCCEAGVKYLTLYTFSTENWQRPATEVKLLMKLMERFLYDEIEEMNENGIRLMISGRKEHIPDFVLEAIRKSTQSTEKNQRLVLNLAFNYSSRAEMVDAIKIIYQDMAGGKLKPEQITEQTISNYLYTATIPDPDLLIRTSGELRISNFLLWQIAYTELCFLDILWPDFRREHLYQAILDYQKRERRFGRVS